MSNYRFKVVPFMGSKNPGNSADSLESLINQHAGSGWEFVAVNDITVEVSPGFLGSILGGKPAISSMIWLSFGKPPFRRL